MNGNTRIAVEQKTKSYKQNASLYRFIFYLTELSYSSNRPMKLHIASHLLYIYFHHVFQFSIDWISPFQILKWWQNLFFRNPFEIIWFKQMNGNSNEYFTVFFFFKMKINERQYSPPKLVRCHFLYFLLFFRSKYSLPPLPFQLITMQRYF